MSCRIPRRRRVFGCHEGYSLGCGGHQRGSARERLQRYRIENHFC
jgi:hypothetical protein